MHSYSLKECFVLRVLLIFLSLDAVLKNATFFLIVLEILFLLDQFAV